MNLIYDLCVLDAYINMYFYFTLLSEKVEVYSTNSWFLLFYIQQCHQPNEVEETRFRTESLLH